MLRGFRINNVTKGVILQRCKACKYEFLKESRYIHIVKFDDSEPMNKFLLECILHQRPGDIYKEYWESREIKLDT